MSSLPVGTSVAGYTIEGVVGRGGMGVVYRARDRALDRAVALKVIDPAHLDDPTARRRFLHEARAAAATEHANVVPVYATGEADGTAYLAMRLVRGEDLRERVRRDGPLPVEQAVSVVTQAAAALDAAHAAGLVHRDVKPANVLLEDGGHVYLTDFGIARGGALTAVTGGGRWVGTSDFVAPEQIRGDALDGRADVYALGGVLHHALTGEAPFPRESEHARLWAHVHAAPPAPSAAGAPKAFDAVVARAMAKDPADRYATAGALARAAQAAAAGAAETVDDPVPEWIAASPASRGGAPRRRVRRVAAVATLLLAAVLGAVVVVGEPDGGRTLARGTAAAPRAAAPPARVTRVFGVGDRPVAVHATGGDVWVASRGRHRLARLDARRPLAPIPGPAVGLGASDLDSRRGVLWVAVAKRSAVSRIDIRTRRRIGQPVVLPGEPRRIDATASAIWVGAWNEGQPDVLVRLDPRTGRITGQLPAPEGIADIAARDGRVWILGRRRSVLTEVRASSLTRLDEMPVYGGPRQLVVAAGSVWTTNHDDDSVSRVRLANREIVTIGVPSKPYGIAAADGAIWVTCYGDKSIVRIDPSTDYTAGRPITVGTNPMGIDITTDAIWVTGAADDSVTRIPY